jgi:peptidoglycan/LPS O-acetylase OafA/YrhL
MIGVYLLSGYNAYMGRKILDVYAYLVFPLLFLLFIYLSEATSLNTEFKKKLYNIKEFFNNPLLIFEFLGVVSYGIYLWHFPIFITLAPGISLNSTNTPVYLARNVIVCVVVICVSIWSYYFVEIPGSKIPKPKFLK